MLGSMCGGDVEARRLCMRVYEEVCRVCVALRTTPGISPHLPPPILLY